MENIVDFIQRHNLKIQGSSGAVASMAIGKTSAKSLGPYVTPAVWALNYTVDGSKPDTMDVGIFAVGLSSTVAAIPATVVSLFKATVDDKTNQELHLVRLGEEQKYRRFIFPCSIFAMNPPAINALTIASKGGTAWQHPNGLWVYILDANGYLVHDFRPRNFAKLYQPEMPLSRGKNGKFTPTIIRGNSK